VAPVRLAEHDGKGVLARHGIAVPRGLLLHGAPEAGAHGILKAQVLEGGRSAVNRLYNRIAGDARHTQVELLIYEEINQRSFAGWSMGQVSMARLNPALVMKYSETAALDPFAVSGSVSMALFEELVATAAIVGQA
jgi:hypothetical protein